MGRPFFSVLIPAFNCESTLLAAVASACVEESASVEVVIVDDASTDSTASLADAIASRDRRVRVVHANTNRGDGPSRNAGLKLVTGEWLVLLDSDDLLIEGALTKLREHIMREPHKADVYITRYFERDVSSNARWRLDECFRDDLAESGPIDPAIIADSLFSTVRSVIANKVWNVDYLREHGLVFQNIPRVGDVYFTLGTLAQARAIEFIDLELYEYRRNHGTSLTSTGDMYPLTFAEASEGLYGFLKERNLSGTWKTGFLNWFNENTLYNLASMKTLQGFSELLLRLQKTTFPFVHFDDLKRSDAIAKEEYDRNLLLQDASVEAALFAVLRKAAASEEDQFFRAEFHRFDAENARCETRIVQQEIGSLQEELERTRSSLSMRVGLAATFIPRTIKASIIKRGKRPTPLKVFNRPSNPLVSVIVPAFNEEAHLVDCVESILNQTFQDFELILVDDGSSDSTPRICDDYAASDRRIIAIHKSNGGLSDARNAGIEIARGPWLSFADADDLLQPEYLSRLLGAAIGTGSEIAVCAIQRFSDTIGAPPQPLHEGIVLRTGREMCEILDVYEGYYYPCAWGKVYARRLFDTLRYPVGRLYEDEFTTFKALYACNSVAEIGDVLYCYRDNPRGIINSGFSLKRIDRVACMEERMAFFSEKGEDELYEKARANRDLFLEWLVDNAREAGLYNQLPERYRTLYETGEQDDGAITGQPAD